MSNNVTGSPSMMDVHWFKKVKYNTIFSIHQKPKKALALLLY